MHQQQKQVEYKTRTGATKKNPTPFFEPASIVQKKMEIGSSNDAFEVEADTMADKVMRMSEPTQTNISHVGALVQRKCAACEEEKIQAKPLAETIQRVSNSSAEASTASSHVENGINSSRGGGSLMDQSTRNFMESRFGTDFSGVRIHTGSQAIQMSRELNAKAFTVGNDIYFNEGKYSPNTNNGKHLLAHELTHTIQQQGMKANRKCIQRQPIRLNSGRIVGNSVAPSSNLKEDVLEVMDSLHVLWELSNPDYASEYPAVSSLPAMTRVPTGTIPHTIAAITTCEQPILNNIVANGVFEMSLTANVGNGQANSKSDIRILQNYLHTRWFLSNPDYVSEFATVNAGSDPVSTASIPKTLLGLTNLKKAKVAEGFRRHDMLTGTRSISARERAQVERILIPGATSSGAVVTIPVPDAICSTIPALETEIRANIVPYVHSAAAAFTARKASPPVLPLVQMNSIADIVQQEIENYFGNYLRVATTSAASDYLPGTYRLRSQLRDQSATLQWQNPDGRKGWVNYWISTRVGNIHHCDSVAIDTVANNIATDATLISDIDTTVQSWPAEATGGININPYLRDATANTDEIRRARWDAFTTILHEAIHHLAHPNFRNTYQQMTDESSQILKEGFNDMFRRELWFGAGQLQTRIGTSAYNTKRATIEGAAYPYNANVVDYHGDYSQVVEANRIRSIVGDRNVKAAYFLGHTELLGLGTGSHGLSATGSYLNVASYHTTDESTNNQVNTLPAETLIALRQRLNATTNRVRNAATRTEIPVGTTTLPPRVIVDGIRHVTIIAGDTLNSVAYQNGVTPFDLIRANNLTTNALTIGNRLIIPIH